MQYYYGGRITIWKIIKRCHGLLITIQLLWTSIKNGNKKKQYYKATTIAGSHISKY